MEKLNEEISKHIKQCCEEGGFDFSPENTIEILRDGKTIDRTELSSHRWWKEYRYVVEIDGMLIGFKYAETTGDMCPGKSGYEFDFSSVRKMREIEKTITTYEPCE